MSRTPPRSAPSLRRSSPVPARPRVWRRVVERLAMRASLAGTALVLMGMNQLPFCNDTQIDPGRGNLDRINDMAVVRPSNDGPQPAVYVVTANPAIKQLRIYETLNRRFVESPNGFFPLSLETGPGTRRLATAARDEGRVYTLDSDDDVVRIVRTRAGGGDPAWTYVGSGFSTGRAPADVAAIALDGDRTIVAVTLPDESVVELFDVDTLDGTLLAYTTVELPEQSFPSRVVSDPTGDAFVVTDAIRNEVHIIRADTRALDRSIDVGGPTMEVSTGLLDPGDGLAPVAVVLRRDVAVAVAIRLFRPAYREDRYALLAQTDLPELGAVSFVPEQVSSERTEPTICCPGVIQPGEPSRAWAMVVSETGRASYLRLDAERPDGTPGVMRLFDNDTAPAGLADQDGVENPVFFPAAGNLDQAPDLVVTVVDSLGTPPKKRYLREVVDVTFTYEGAPPRTSNRTANWSLGAVDVDPDGRAFDERDVRVGDALFIPTVGRSDERCPADGFLERSISALDGNRVELAGLSTDDIACLQVFGPFTFSVRTSGAFVVASAPGSYLGRVGFANDPEGVTEVRVANVALEVFPSASGLPQPGSQLVVSLTDNVSPVGMYIAQEVTFADQTGFDQDGLVPTGIGGSEAFLPGTNDGDPARAVRRVFLTTAGINGRIIEFNETETVLSFVNSDVR